MADFGRMIDFDHMWNFVSATKFALAKQEDKQCQRIKWT